MSDIMKPIELKKLLNWIFNEYSQNRTIFGISKNNFYNISNHSNFALFDKKIDTPVGPAAGPHTQLAQNIISAYLTGGRFFELKTVQILDELKIEKPCIDAEDEGYNVEWSQELKLEQSFSEYLKAWLIIHLLKPIFFSKSDQSGFIFNMSVGYNLDGIKDKRMDLFIEQLKNSDLKGKFSEYKELIIDFLKTELICTEFLKNSDSVFEYLESIPAEISSSVTLSTMHGCPADEIQSIAEYLIKEKKLNTFVKLNPTLLGFEKVRNILDELDYKYISLDKKSFEHDIDFNKAIKLINNLKNYAKENGKIFGIKLSNTLGVNNLIKSLPGDQMYMSGRSLFPLTINLASALADVFNGDLNISYSGGATQFNTKSILETGIYPVTYATDLLKPGGYNRLYEICKQIEGSAFIPGKIIDTEKLESLAKDSLTNPIYRKNYREIKSIKVDEKLQLFDCYIAPCQIRCPIHQDVPAYIKLIGEKEYLKAFYKVIEKNPLPHITGYICDHQCMNHCTRWDYDSTVAIRDMKKEAALSGYDEFIRSNYNSIANENGKIKVAVIGAGPAGLSSAYFLAKTGFDVTIYEKRNSAGGVVKNIIPEFRIPQDVIDKDLEIIKKTGVKFINNAESDFSVEKLKDKGFKYIIIAIGAEKSNELELSGNGKIIDVLEFLEGFHHKENFDFGKVVAVVGGGNSAMDGARAALRIKGVENVKIIYRRTKEYMPADKEELFAAIDDGIEFMELLLPVEYNNNVLKCQKMTLTEKGSDGRRGVKAIDGLYEEVQVDTIIAAIGEKVDSSFLSSNKIILEKNHYAKIDPQTLETCISDVFIAGDAVKGPATVVEAIADGTKVAKSILKKENLIWEEFHKEETYFDKTPLIHSAQITKGKVFNEPHSEEAERCLSCNLICNKCVDVCPNRANVNLEIEGFKDRYQIIHLDFSCNECGNCETFCPHTGSPYKDKPTLFSSIEDFIDSTNDGFYITELNGNYRIKTRYQKSIGELLFNENYQLTESDISIADSEKFVQFINLIKAILKDYKYFYQ